MGVLKEKTGRNDGAQVAMVLKSVGLAEGNPYCAAGIVWSFVEACKQLATKVPIAITGLANGIYNQAKAKGKYAEHQTPQVGDLIVWKHSRTISGHIERIKEKRGRGWVITQAYNTSSGNGGSQRDGNGAYNRLRYLGGLGTMYLRGYVGYYEV